MWTIKGGIQTAASENRGDSIGSSEIAAVIGVCPYRTPYQLWGEKMNGSSFVGNKYTRAGKILEPAVIQYFTEESGASVLPGYEEDVRFTHPALPFATSTPDRPYTREGGRRGICEAKTTQFLIKDESEVPPSWFCQAQYQAAVFNAVQEALGGEPCNEIAIAWLTRGVDFQYAYFEVDQDFGESLLEQASTFWHDYIETGIAPEYETPSDIEKAFPTSKGGLNATPETVAVYESLIDVDEKLKHLKAEREALSDSIKMAMKGAEELTYYGSVLATWKHTKPTRRLDAKRLKEEAPDIYETFLGKAVRQRRFLVKS